MLRAHLCECGDSRCRERIYLRVVEYRRLSARGRVVAFGHAPSAVVLDARQREGYAVVALVSAPRRAMVVT